MASPKDALFKEILRTKCAERYDSATCLCMEEWYKQIDLLLGCQINYGRMIGRFNMAASNALGYYPGTEHFLGDPGVTQYVVPQYAIEVSLEQQPWNTPLEVCHNQLEAGDVAMKQYIAHVRALHDLETYFRWLSGLPAALPPTPPVVE